MRRLEIPDGLYGEALPDGQYAVLVKGAHIQTHLGNIPLPAEEVGGWGPLYLRIASAPFRVAGQASQVAGVTWERTYRGGWWGGGWGDWKCIPLTACGVSPVIYDRDGVLHISDCSIGSQGWRYVSDAGELITGDATYAHPTLRVAEWTEHGGITIGQGYAGGAILCYQGVSGPSRAILEPGDCRFIRFNRAGDRLAVTIVKFVERTTVIYWLTVDEIASLLHEATLPAPQPEPPPQKPRKSRKKPTRKPKPKKRKRAQRR